MNNKTLLLDHGSHICVSAYSDKDRLESLRPAVYEIAITDSGVKLFTLQEKFQVAERKFGNHNLYKKTLIEDYDRVGPSVGAILFGVKGSGKTLLAEDVCNHYLKLGLPIIRVTFPVPLPVLELVSAAVGPAVFYFDEFGKVYRRTEGDDPREGLLGFFGNATRLGSIYLVTANNLQSELSEFMINRPGRFRYCFNFSSPEDAHLEEVFDHYMIADSLRPMLRAYVHDNECSYDVLCSLLPVIRGCKDRDEVDEKTKIFNIPLFPNWGVTNFRLIDEMYSDENSGAFGLNSSITNQIWDAKTNILHYRIRVKEKTEDGVKVVSKMRSINVDDLEQFRIPAIFELEKQRDSVNYEFADADGAMLTLTFGWSGRHVLNAQGTLRSVKEMERRQEVNDGREVESAGPVRFEPVNRRSAVHRDPSAPTY